MADLELADGGFRISAGLGDGDRAVLVDGDVRCAGGDGDVGLKEIAVAHAEDQLAVVIDEEVAVAGIAKAVANGVENFYFEKAVALDGDVKLAVCGLKGAVGHIQLGI